MTNPIQPADAELQEDSRKTKINFTGVPSTVTQLNAARYPKNSQLPPSLRSELFDIKP